MPELPEVETIRCGLVPHLEHKIIQDVIIRYPQLRWPIPSHLQTTLSGQQVKSLSRRGKYLFIHVAIGTLIIHLGMSGRLRILKTTHPLRPHDHVDFILSNQLVLRYNDSRRFGAILWTKDNPLHHPLIQSMGVEPLENGFTGEYLKKRAFKRQVPIKSLIMDGKIVTGIGNIYATEALFLAKIHPLTPAGTLTDQQYDLLVSTAQDVLRLAIAQGGTTLKDFVNTDGKPGYFSQKLYVYGRTGLPCLHCHTKLKSLQIGQRTTVYCEQCQPEAISIKETT